MMADTAGRHDRETTGNITLFCPECGYNLTGLPENRCPECGGEFDPQRLAQEIRDAPEPITLRRALLHLLWPPALFLVAGLAGLISQEARAFVLAVVVLLVVFYGFVNASMLAERVVASQAARAGKGFSLVRNWGFIMLCFFGLYVFQLGAGAVGLVICITLWTWLE